MEEQSPVQQHVGSDRLSPSLVRRLSRLFGSVGFAGTSGRQAIRSEIT
jgi:hypothetical protein